MAGNDSQLRYISRNYCIACRRWIDKSLHACPYCGGARIRTAPRMPRCRKKYGNNNREYTLEEAREIYERFLARGYDPEEALEFTQAITGVMLSLQDVKTVAAEAVV